MKSRITALSRCNERWHASSYALCDLYQDVKCTNECMELGPCAFNRKFDRNCKVVYFWKINCHQSEVNGDTVAGSSATGKVFWGTEALISVLLQRGRTARELLYHLPFRPGRVFMTAPAAARSASCITLSTEVS